MQHSLSTAVQALADDDDDHHNPSNDPAQLHIAAQRLVDATAAHTAAHVDLCQAYARAVIRKVDLLQRVLESMQRLVSKEQIERLQVGDMVGMYMGERCSTTLQYNAAVQCCIQYKANFTPCSGQFVVNSYVCTNHTTGNPCIASTDCMHCITSACAAPAGVACQASCRHICR